VTDRLTNGQTGGQNYDSQDRTSIAASRGKHVCVHNATYSSLGGCSKARSALNNCQLQTF